jgi:hypothetical protein
MTRNETDGLCWFTVQDNTAWYVHLDDHLCTSLQDKGRPYQLRVVIPKSHPMEHCIMAVRGLTETALLRRRKIEYALRH